MYEQYKLNPLITRQRMFSETMEDVLPELKVVITDGASRRTLVYNDGYIIREETAGKVLRYLYDYDSATFKKYLIGINEVDRETPGGERKFDYEIDMKGRITRCTITQDGKEEMTLTRRYSN